MIKLMSRRATGEWKPATLVNGAEDIIRVILKGYTVIRNDLLGPIEYKVVQTPKHRDCPTCECISWEMGVEKEEAEEKLVEGKVTGKVKGEEGKVRGEEPLEATRSMETSIPVYKCIVDDIQYRLVYHPSTIIEMRTGHSGNWVRSAINEATFNHWIAIGLIKLL